MHTEQNDQEPVRPGEPFSGLRQAARRPNIQKSVWISLLISLILTFVFKSTFFLLVFPLYPLQQFWRNLKSELK